MTDLAPARLVAPWWRRLWARLVGCDYEREALLRHENDLLRALTDRQQAMVLDGPMSMPVAGPGRKVP